jgi:hypothetical protein
VDAAILRSTHANKVARDSTRLGVRNLCDSFEAVGRNALPLTTSMPSPRLGVRVRKFAQAAGGSHYARAAGRLAADECSLFQDEAISEK